MKLQHSLMEPVELDKNGYQKCLEDEDGREEGDEWQKEGDDTTNRVRNKNSGERNK